MYDYKGVFPLSLVVKVAEDQDGFSNRRFINILLMIPMDNSSTKTGSLQEQNSEVTIGRDNFLEGKDSKSLNYKTVLEITSVESTPDNSQLVLSIKSLEEDSQLN